MEGDAMDKIEKLQKRLLKEMLRHNMKWGFFWKVKVNMKRQ